jgi:hypothetical protein
MPLLQDPLILPYLFSNKIAIHAPIKQITTIPPQTQQPDNNLFWLISGYSAIRVHFSRTEM